MAANREHATLNRDSRSLGTLFSDLTHETTQLVRKEIELAKAEMSRKLDRMQTGAISLAAGGFVAYAGFIVLLFAAVMGLDAVLDRWYPTSWLSPLIVGLVVVVVGYVLLRKGMANMKADNLVPRRTFESLRRDAQVARDQVY